MRQFLFLNFLCTGQIYRPNIVRVGADNSVAPSVRERLLQRLVSRYTDMSQAEWQQRCASGTQKLRAVQHEMHALELSIGRASNPSEASHMARVSY